SLRDAIYFRLAGVRCLFGAAARCRSFLLTRSFRYPPRIDKRLNNMHHAEKYLAMVYALGAPCWQGEMPDIEIGVSSSPQGEALTRALAAKRVMTLAAGAAYGAAKRWPSDHFRKVADYWIQHGGTVAILGSAGERRIAKEIAAGLPPEHCCDLTGGTDLMQLMTILRHGTICVANDSGIMHLCAALGGRGIAVFGPTDPSATAPVSADWTVVFEKQPCAPCFKRVCPLNSIRCMHIITAEKVIRILKRLTADAS
ncbi:MAG: glycosyltransferase family 9 protein, partial [Victivallales bacterium]|nr:glycosyltransferase family 9 protein [Victivallales bacterium]